MTFQTNFKGPRVSTATLRRRKHDRLKRAENGNKQEVRDRDVLCRFPLCKCFELGLRLDVSHMEHKGMGGDPTGDRSSPDKMIYVCFPRHMDAKIAIDKKTLRVVPLTDRGTNGPVAWEVNVGRLSAGADEWIELARETARGVLAALSDRQRMMLDRMGQELKKAYG